MVSGFVGNEWHNRAMHRMAFLAVALHPVFLCVIAVSNENGLEEKFCVGRKFRKISKTRKNMSGPWKTQCALTFRFYT